MGCGSVKRVTGLKGKDHTAKHLETPLGVIAGGTCNAAHCFLEGGEKRRLPWWVCAEGTVLPRER